MLKKVFVLLIICATLLPNFCISIHAKTIDTPTDVIERWVSITSLRGGISFSDNTGTYTMKITGTSSVTKIEATATLYYINSRGNQTKVTTWTYDENSSKLTIEEDFNAISEREYVVVLEGTAYIGSSGESFDNSVSNTCP